MTHLSQDSPEPAPPITVLRRQSRSALVAALTGAVIVTGMALLQRRMYTMELLVATVQSTPGAEKLSGAAAGLLNLTQGFEVTSALVSRLLRINSVLEEVADAPTISGSKLRIVDAAFPGKSIEPAFRAREMERLVRTSVDKESGIISLEVTLPDSALARRTLQLLTASVRKAFARVSRAQATELRMAQEQRVAVAGEQLRAADESVAQFAARNRVVTEYSTLQAERRKLDRADQIAQTVYMQAVSDRESAVGKELENAPALVIVDEIPSIVAANPRHLFIKAVFGAMLGVFIFLIYRYLLDSMPQTGATG